MGFAIKKWTILSLLFQSLFSDRRSGFRADKKPSISDSGSYRALFMKFYPFSRVPPQNASDFINKNLTIRCTEVFFLTPLSDCGLDQILCSRLISQLAHGAAQSMQSHLHSLRASFIDIISLRVQITSDQCGYELGAKNAPLEARFLTSIDDLIIPVINGVLATPSRSTMALNLELFFRIL